MQFSQFDTMMSGVKHCILVIDPSSAEMKMQPAPKTHHVLIFDRSYSMAPYLNTLMDQVAHVLEILGSKDLLSMYSNMEPIEYERPKNKYMMCLWSRLHFHFSR